MQKVLLKLSLLALVVLVVPACKRKKAEEVGSAAVHTKGAPGKKVAVFDDNLDAFVVDEDDSAFGLQGAQVSLMEMDNDVVLESSKHGFMSIRFEFDANCMKPNQMGAMEHNLARAKKLVAQGHIIVISGHACKFAGSDEYNMHLSEKRAQCVRDYFIRNGIPSHKIKIVGRGSEMCVVPTGNKEQQAPNRRAEFTIITAPAA